MNRSSPTIGTAGWSIPRALADSFPSEGSHLERYSRVLTGAEINSSFYREHSFTTYAKWAAATPRNFQFSVKLPQAITHELQLRRARAPFRNFLDQTAGLGSKRGPILIQLPPSLQYASRLASVFFAMLREEYDGAIVCEPRHASWFEPKADAVLTAHRIGRVATDPTRIEVARVVGGWMGDARRSNNAVAYYRLHGSPRKYWSRYDGPRLREWATSILELSRRAQVWCMFDNTASGAALANACEMRAMITSPDAKTQRTRHSTRRRMPSKHT